MIDNDADIDTTIENNGNTITLLATHNRLDMLKYIYEKR